MEHSQNNLSHLSIKKIFETTKTIYTHTNTFKPLNPSELRSKSMQLPISLQQITNILFILYRLRSEQKWIIELKRIVIYVKGKNLTFRIYDDLKQFQFPIL